MNPFDRLKHTNEFYFAMKESGASQADISTLKAEDARQRRVTVHRATSDADLMVCHPRWREVAELSPKARAILQDVGQSYLNPFASAGGVTYGRVFFLARKFPEYEFWYKGPETVPEGELVTPDFE